MSRTEKITFAVGAIIIAAIEIHQLYCDRAEYERALITLGDHNDEKKP